MDNNTPEVVVTGIHLTFSNVMYLTVMVVGAQAVIGVIVGIVLYWLGVI